VGVLCFVYTMFPAAKAAPSARNVARRGVLANLYSVCKLCYVLLSFLTVYHGIRDGPSGKGAAESRKLYRALRFGPRSTTNASTFPPGPSRSNGVPHVFHVLIKVWHVFRVLSRLSTDETWTPGSFGVRLCPRYKKKASQAIAIIVSWDFDQTIHACPRWRRFCVCIFRPTLCIHPVFASARRPASVPEREGQSWKMASKKPRFLGVLKNLKNLKNPKFRFLRFFCFDEILYKSYLISYFNCDLWVLL